MNKKITYIAGIVLIVALVAIAGLTLVQQQSKSDDTTTATDTPKTSVTPTPTKQASSSATTAPTIRYKGESGKTALELLKQHYPDTETKKTSFGDQVVAIGGRTADDSKNEYWEFLVNGKSSNEGAGTYQTKSGDVLEWKIATY